VGLDRRLAEEEPLRELGVGQAAGDQAEHLGFALGQLAERRGALAGRRPADELLQEPAGDGRREQQGSVTGNAVLGRLGHLAPAVPVLYFALPVALTLLAVAAVA
jgi:hypothetical protein